MSEARPGRSRCRWHCLPLCLWMLATCGPAPAGPVAPSGRGAGWDAGNGTPGSPMALASGEPVQGDTTGRASSLGSSCGAGAGGPEVVYVVRIEELSRVRVELATEDHDGTLHVQRVPDGVETACNEDAPDAHRSLLMTILEPGEYLVVADGSGSDDQGPFTLRFDAVRFQGVDSPGDSCAHATPVQQETPTDTVVHTSTFDATDSLQTRCASSPGGPDRFLQIPLTEPALVSATVVGADFSAPVLSLLSDCQDDDGVCGTSRVWSSASHGCVLVVDSLGADQWGDVRVAVKVRSLQALEKRCQGAEDLPLEGSVQGHTQASDDFDASCGQGAPGPETVYRLSLDEDSRVSLTLNSPGFDGVLHVRSQCSEPGSEAGCNDDHGSQNSSRLQLELKSGTYWVYVDGATQEDAGPFTLQVQVAAIGQK